MPWRGVHLFGKFMVGAENFPPKCPDCHQRARSPRYQPEWLGRDALSYPQVKPPKAPSNAFRLETHPPNRPGPRSLDLKYGRPKSPPVRFVATKLPAPPPLRSNGGVADSSKDAGEDGMDSTQDDSPSLCTNPVCQHQRRQPQLPRQHRRQQLQRQQLQRAKSAEHRPQRKRYHCASHHNLLVQDRMAYLGPPVGKGWTDLEESTRKQLPLLPAGILTATLDNRLSRRRVFLPVAPTPSEVSQKQEEPTTGAQAGEREESQKADVRKVVIEREPQKADVRKVIVGQELQKADVRKVIVGQESQKPDIRKVIIQQESQKPDIRKVVVQEELQKPDVRRVIVQEESQKPDVRRVIVQEESQKPDVRKVILQEESQKPDVRRVIVQQESQKPDLRQIAAECVAFKQSKRRPARRMFPPQRTFLYPPTDEDIAQGKKWSSVNYTVCKKII